MKSEDRLNAAFDNLASDINELLRRYRKAKRDRAALLNACLYNIFVKSAQRAIPS